MKPERAPISPIQTTEAPKPAAVAATNGITLRCVLIGLFLSAINSYWVTLIEVRYYTLDGTCLPLFVTPVFFLFFLALGNLGLRRVLPKWSFSQAELLTVYTFLVMGTLMAGHDLLQNLFGSIGHAHRFVTPENNWKSLFFPLLPTYWLVTDPTALKGYYQGNVSPADPAMWRPFIAPLLWWGLFIGTLIGVCLCLNILVRRTWADHERLTFPIVQIPIALTENSGVALFSNRLMWMGFALAASIDLLNGFHALYPSLPYLEYVKQFNIGQFFNSPPLNVISDTKIALYPFAIGLAYFVPLELSFSCWFFFLARLVFRVTGNAAGWDGQGNQGFPFFEQQASGAWLAWGVTIAWALRKPVTEAWREAFKKNSRDPEARLYRFAFGGIGAGIAVLAGFSVKLGLSFWVATLFFGIYFLLALTLTRVRAELGTPHEIYFVNPRLILVSLFGSQALGAGNLTALSTMYWFNRGYRCHPMPNELEAIKMGDAAGMRRRTVIFVMTLALVWGFVFACWSNLHVTFTEGASSKATGFKTWVGGESYDRLQGWLQTPTRVNYNQQIYLAVGAIFTIFLRVMRGSFLWFPFHPAGYALAVSFAMDYFWFCFFVAWMLKALIVRFGGMKAYQTAIPFFLGLVLGDYVMGSIWILYNALSGISVYKIFI